MLNRGFLESDIRQSPRLPLFWQLGLIDCVEEPLEVIRDQVFTVVGGRNAIVVAVIAGEPLAYALDRPTAKVHPPTEIGIDVIAEEHVFVETVDRIEVVA